MVQLQRAVILPNFNTAPKPAKSQPCVQTKPGHRAVQTLCSYLNSSVLHTRQESNLSTGVPVRMIYSDDFQPDLQITRGDFQFHHGQAPETKPECKRWNISQPTSHSLPPLFVHTARMVARRGVAWPQGCSRSGRPACAACIRTWIRDLFRGCFERRFRSSFVLTSCSRFGCNFVVGW